MLQLYEREKAENISTDDIAPGFWSTLIHIIIYNIMICIDRQINILIDMSEEVKIENVSTMIMHLVFDLYLFVLLFIIS